MKDKTEVTRRRFLKATGVAGAIGVAGCVGGASPDAEDDSTNNVGSQNKNGDVKGKEENHSGGDHSEEEDHHSEEEDHHSEEEDHHDDSEKNHEDEEQSENHEENGENGEEHHEHEHNHGDAHEHTIGEPVEEIEIELITNGEGQHFLPHMVHIKKGGKVTWKLKSGSHDTTAYHPDNDKPLRMPEKATPWASELMTEEGDTFEKTFDVEGVYDYLCTPHEAMGMVGRVIVGEPDMHEQKALEAPHDSMPGEAKEIIKEFNTRTEDKLHNH